uniref:Uncharacterized protein n=1 Tax=Arion vulgaris TaxID=1028688 RepID=A0A0B7AA87_9EUPU
MQSLGQHVINFAIAYSPFITHVQSISCITVRQYDPILLLTPVNSSWLEIIQDTIIEF